MKTHLFSELWEIKSSLQFFFKFDFDLKLLFYQRQTLFSFTLNFGLCDAHHHPLTTQAVFNMPGQKLTPQF